MKPLQGIIDSVLVWTFSSLLIAAAVNTDVFPKKEILILGGNGFMGSKTTSNLLEKGHNVTVLNRGTNYYDWETKIRPFVSRHISCDRDKSLLLECKELSEERKHYDVVIDFTSYSPKQVLQVIESLSGRVGFYLFISSEAVYEVSSKNHTNPSREEEAVRPVSHKLRRELQDNDLYGDQKLACEEVLQKQRGEGGFPFVVLRLPIAIGPRDTSFRWWIYQLWVLTHAVIHYPLHIPNGIRSEFFSMVYVDDVADVISRIVAMDKPKLNSIQNMAINLAFKEHVTLPKVIKDIANYYGIDQLQHNGDDNSTWYAYPVGTKGPVDISLAQKVLDWDPVPWKEAVKSTCDFYHRAMTKIGYAKEKEIVLADMIEHIVSDEYYKDFLMNLKQHFGGTVLNGIDLEGGIPDGAPEIDTSANVASGSSDKENVADEL